MSSPIPSFRSVSRSPSPRRQDKNAARPPSPTTTGAPLPAQGRSPLRGRLSRLLGSSTATNGESSSGAANAFSRFFSKIDFRPPAFGRPNEKLRPRVSLMGEPLQEYDASQEVAAAATAEEAERRSSIIGLTAAGERVHAKANGVGASAVVQWSSPVERGPQIRSHARSTVLSASSSDGKYGKQVEEDEEYSIFTPGDCLRFQLTFGEGPAGLKLADTKAGKGVYVHDFTQIQTKSGPVATAAELSGRVRIGDLIVRVGSTDVSFSPKDVVQGLLDKGPRPVTVSFERYPQCYSFQEVTQDPRKVPFYFEYLLAEVVAADPRHEQAKVMLLIESEQYKSQHKDMTLASRAHEAKRIYDKFFDSRSHFDVSADVTSEVLEALKAQCCLPALAPAAAPEPYPEAFDAARLLIQEDILRGSFPSFRKSTAHQRMLGFLARSPEFVPLDPMDVLADDDARHYFMLYLMSNRKHATLRCYLDMERFVKPKVHELEALLKNGDVDSERAKRAVTELLQAALRVFSLYLCANGSYMAVTLRPLTRLTRWLRGMLNSHGDIPRIQRRARKLATTEAAEAQILGCQLLKEAHKPDPGVLFATLSVPDALAIGHEVLEAQRSLLQELTSEIFPRFQSSPLYEALCEEIGTGGAKQKPLTLRPGSIKKLLRRVKLPREFAVHRTALPAPSASSSSPTALRPDDRAALSPLLRLSSPVSPGSQMARDGSVGQHPAPRPVVDSPADWLCVFDTEFTPNMAIKIRTTRQIPVSEHARSLGKACPLPPGVEAFMVPEEFPTKLGAVPPEPQLFNFLVPGRDEQPFYGACLLMYRPATEALPTDSDVMEGSTSSLATDDEPFDLVLNVDLTSTQSQTGEEEKEQATVAVEAASASGRVSSSMAPWVSSSSVKGDAGDASFSSPAFSSPVFGGPGGTDVGALEQQPPRVMRALSAYRIDRGNEGQEHVKAIADSIFSSPRRAIPGNGPNAAAVEDSWPPILPPSPCPALHDITEEADGVEAGMGAPPSAEGLAASTSSMLSAAVEGKEGANREGDDDHDDDDSSIIIAMVEGDFQQALLASYQTFAAQETARTANEAGAVLALPTVVSPDQQPPTNHKGAAALGGLGPVGQAPSSSFSFGQTPPPPLYHQSFSYLPAPVRRRGSLLEQRGQQLRHGSTSVSIGRDSLVAAVARALPVTLTYAPYGFCLISCFPFVNSLRAPLSALFEQDFGVEHSPSAVRAIQDFLKAQPPVPVPLSANGDESLFLGPPQASGPHSAAPPPGLLSPAHDDSQAQHPPSLRQHIDFKLETLFRALCPRNLVLVFLALLLESKVLLVSERLTLLTIAGEGLRLLLHPLKWCHLFVPLVPEVMVERLIGCPTPFLMGLHRKTFLLRRDEFPADVVRVDLDNDYVEVPAQDLNSKLLPFAGPLARRFERFANPSTALSDSVRWRVEPPPTRAGSAQTPPTPQAPLAEQQSPSHASSLHLPQLCKPDVRGALLVLRAFVQNLLIGVEDSCVFIRTETELTILFDETLFKHISGPPELMVTTLHDAETDLLPHSPHLPPPPVASTDAAQEGFVLRFCRTQAFSAALISSVSEAHGAD